jgi:hypothetical protein
MHGKGFNKRTGKKEFPHWDATETEHERETENIDLSD